MYRILFAVALLLAQFSFAQNFGGFPPSTRWQQINTDTARIIFAAPAGEQAQRIASIIHKMAADTPVALGKRQKKINVVLHNRTTEANGYVALGPFRSEYYLIPSSNIFEFGNLPWHENLAIHEYRHVQQYNNFNNGLTKLFQLFGGQNGRALANALTVPDWFFEGDAVYAETALTGLGRGRLPLFLSAYNSLWQEGKEYSWMKLRNGSYKDFVPNHYQLGYLLVNYGYLKYSDEFWKKVSHDASAFKGLAYPFQKGVKRYAGVDYKTFRREALYSYSQKIKENKKVAVADKTVTQYYYPQWISTDSLIYLKESYQQLPAFYVKDSKGEHRVKLRHIGAEDWFSYRNGTVAYTAFATNARWSLVDYSDIVLLDIQTKEEKRLTRKGKYYTPDIAPGGKELVAVSINDSLQSELQVLSSSDGAVLRKISALEGAYFVHPKYIDEENIVVGIRQQNGSMTWNLMNIRTGAAQQLMAPSLNSVGFPAVHDGTVYFVSSFTANDDIYAFQLKDKKFFQLTTGQTGNYFPSVYKDSIAWSTFTASGLQLQQKGLKEMLWQEVNALQLQEQAVLYPVAEAGQNVLTAATRTFPVNKYSKATGLFNFHSWDPGLTLYSNNILNTFATTIQYQYGETEQSHTAGINLSYGGWFPVINAGYEYTFDRHIKFRGRTYTADEWDARIGYNIPLNFTKGKTLKSLNFGSNYVMSRFMPTGIFKDSLRTTDYSYLQHFVGWAQQLQRARQHIFPRLGYAFSVNGRHRLDEKGYQLRGNSALYLPGLFTNHSLVLSGSFQNVDTGSRFFSNDFKMARGYEDEYFSRMWNVGVNYHMPLLYPDWGFANLVYFLRVRSNFFFDHTRVQEKYSPYGFNLNSVGSEMYFDTKWWNQLPVTFGVRYSYLLNPAFVPNEGSRHRFELIVPVDLVPF